MTSEPTGPGEPSSEDEERAAGRADLLPEEQAAGSADPQAQAEAILAESDERTEDPSGTRADSVQTPGTDADDRTTGDTGDDGGA